jgi:site-specific recombinase XerD
MSEKDNDSTDEELPNLPEKLSERIEEADVELTDDPIYTNGRQTLNSNNPVRVVEFYLETMESEWTKATFQDKSYDLTRFLEYCESVEIDDLSEISKQDLTGFRDWRKLDENINLTSLHGQLANIRVFLRWCEDAELVPDGLPDEMEIPDEEDINDVSYVRIEAEEADRIIEYHQQFPYVKREFAEFVIMWAGLCRLGDVRSLDLDNYDRDEGYIELEHDLDEETPLKNGESDGDTEHGGGERPCLMS